MQHQLWNHQDNLTELRNEFQSLINDKLPATYQYPVRFNHCFNRIILDWLFKDVWYSHLDRNKTAISQLSEMQLKDAIERMKLWLANKDVLVNDNENSIHYRGRSKLSLNASQR